MLNLEEIAKRHGVSVGVVQTLYEGLQRTRGGQVQFNHPELGGMGQWMPSMVMVGRMNDHALKAQVDALCSELAGVAITPTVTESKAFSSATHWWPEELGASNAVGAQNDIRYAYFAGKERLAIFENGKVTLYDTRGYHISGFGQQQQSAIPGTLSLHTDRGTIPLNSLPVVR